MAWLEAWHRALSLPRLSSPSWTVAAVLSCASSGLQTRDVAGRPLQGQFLFGGERGGGPAAACSSWARVRVSGWDRSLQGTQNAGACAAPAPKAQGNTSPYRGEHSQAAEHLHQAKVSATEPRVTDDKRVMTYWENRPIKNKLEDPVYRLMPFKYSTVTNTPYSYKLKKGGEVILPHTV